jgi:ABC-type transporter MlaC component
MTVLISMIDFLQQNWEAMFTFIAGGGLLTLGTAKYAKKSAEASAMKEWQGVYQETIKDLREDKVILKSEMSELKKIVDQNTHDIEELKSYECIVVDCALRKKRPRINIPIDYERDK